MYTRGKRERDTTGRGSALPLVKFPHAVRVALRGHGGVLRGRRRGGGFCGVVVRVRRRSL